MVFGSNSKVQILLHVVSAHGFAISTVGRTWVAEKRVCDQLLRVTLAGDLKKAARRLGLLAQYEAGLFAFNQQ